MQLWTLYRCMRPILKMQEMLLTLDKFCKDGADAIVFTSSSTALSFVEQEEDLN